MFAFTPQRAKDTYEPWLAHQFALPLFLGVIRVICTLSAHVLEGDETDNSPKKTRTKKEAGVSREGTPAMSMALPG